MDSGYFCACEKNSKTQNVQLKPENRGKIPSLTVNRLYRCAYFLMKFPIFLKINEALKIGQRSCYNTSIFILLNDKFRL